MCKKCGMMLKTSALVFNEFPRTSAYYKLNFLRDHLGLNEYPICELNIEANSCRFMRTVIQKYFSKIKI